MANPNKPRVVDSDHAIAAPSRQNWAIFASSLVALVPLIAGLTLRHGAWVLLAVPVGLLLPLLAFRRKAAPLSGALWSGSADLMRGEAQLPGQLSFTSDRLAWTPSVYSRKRGLEPVVVPLDRNVVISFSSGPGLLDLFVDVRTSDRELRLLTHRGAKLRRVVDQLRSDPSCTDTV